MSGYTTKEVDRISETCYGWRHTLIQRGLRELQWQGHQSSIVRGYSVPARLVLRDGDVCTEVLHEGGRLSRGLLQKHVAKIAEFLDVNTSVISRCGLIYRTHTIIVEEVE